MTGALLHLIGWASVGYTLLPVIFLTAAATIWLALREGTLAPQVRGRRLTLCFRPAARRHVLHTGGRLRRTLVAFDSALAYGPRGLSRDDPAHAWCDVAQWSCEN